MKAQRPQILLVDDDVDALEALVALFSSDYEVLSASSGSESIEIAEKAEDLAAVVMDIKMPGMNGIDAARRIRRLRPFTPVIFHTAYPGDYNEDQVDREEHPFEYVKKADPISRLRRAVRNATESFAARKSPYLSAPASVLHHGIVGRSPQMLQILSVIRRVGPTDTKVMIRGETGTGKELVARALHEESKRKTLAILNCNHKSPDLVESELFGHCKGAFTNVENRVGLFEYADRGTVFLDEIGDLDITTQAKILRVLETGEYQKQGDPQSRRTDVRILCATNRNLDSMVDEKQFREDLFFRLRGVVITLPPLRDRREDIPLLTKVFADRLTVEQGLPPKVLDRSAVDVLMQFNWPGNVRQLHDVIESLLVLCESDLIIGEDVLQQLGSSRPQSSAGSSRLEDRVNSYRRMLISEALAEAGGNVAAAARELAIDRNNLRKWIIKYGLKAQQ
jgi:DNA-binding NtrC family response regulator